MQEYQEIVTKHMDDEDLKREASAKLYEFDMQQAIEAALDNSNIPTVSTHVLDPSVSDICFICGGIKFKSALSIWVKYWHHLGDV